MENLPKSLITSGATRIAEGLGSVSGGKVLDVATGDGGFIDTLTKALKDYASFIGIDNSREQVESAKKRFKGHVCITLISSIINSKLRVVWTQ